MKKNLLAFALCLMALVFCSCKGKKIPESEFDYFSDFEFGMDKEHILLMMEVAGMEDLELVAPLSNPDIYHEGRDYNIVTMEDFIWGFEFEGLYRFYFSEDDKLEHVSVYIPFDVATRPKKFVKQNLDAYKICKKKIEEYLLSINKAHDVKKWTEDYFGQTDARIHTSYICEDEYFDVSLLGNAWLVVYRGKDIHKCGYDMKKFE